MGYALRGRKNGEDAEIELGEASWSNLLKAALAHGWEPMGAEVDRDWIVKRMSEDPDNPDEEAERRATVFILEWEHGDRIDTYFQNSTFQTVTAQDAANLADAIDRALPEFIDDDDVRDAQEIVCLCRSGQFYIA